MLTLTEILGAAQAAILAYVITLLMQDGHLLEQYRRCLERGQWSWRAAWAAKPLGLCGRCLSGQIGFWSGAVAFGIHPAKVVLFASLTIFFHEIISKNAGS